MPPPQNYPRTNPKKHTKDPLTVLESSGGLHGLGGTLHNQLEPFNDAFKLQKIKNSQGISSSQQTQRQQQVLVQSAQGISSSEAANGIEQLVGGPSNPDSSDYNKISSNPTHTPQKHSSIGGGQQKQLELDTLKYRKAIKRQQNTNVGVTK